MTVGIRAAVRDVLQTFAYTNSYNVPHFNEILVERNSFCNYFHNLERKIYDEVQCLLSFLDAGSSDVDFRCGAKCGNMTLRTAMEEYGLNEATTCEVPIGLSVFCVTLTICMYHIFKRAASRGPRSKCKKVRIGFCKLKKTKKA